MKIKIDSYKNIRDITIPVVNNKLILLGANGVGKTNILEAINSGKAELIDCDQEFERSYLLNLTLNRNSNEHYPNSSYLMEIVKDRNGGTLSERIMNYLEEAYELINRPLVRRVISDALDSIRFAEQNQDYDPSPLAITRLIILCMIYQQCLNEGKKYIILMDTPELYAHPLMLDQITAVLNLLHKAGCLIVISTHSDRVISRVFSRFEELVKVSKEADGRLNIMLTDMEKIEAQIREFYGRNEYLTHSFSRSTHPDDGLVSLLNNGISSFLITALRDKIITAYFSEVIILGEGTSEDVLFDYIDNEIHPNWISELQVGFINCLGKSTMPLYFIFLNAIGISTFIFYDYDNNLNPVHVAFRDAFEQYHKENRNMFREYYLNPDLEGFLNVKPPEGRRADSLVKPLQIFDYTFLNNGNTARIDELMQIMEKNARILIERKKK